MDYKYDDCVELLLAHMNVEDIINAAERLYQLEEVEEEEGLSQEEMDENEEAGDVVEGSGRERTVRYGTVTDLLSFVNLLSDMQPAGLQRLSEEMGVLLNKVRSLNGNKAFRARFVFCLNFNSTMKTSYQLTDRSDCGENSKETL